MRESNSNQWFLTISDDAKIDMHLSENNANIGFDPKGIV